MCSIWTTRQLSYNEYTDHVVLVGRREGEGDVWPPALVCMPRLRKWSCEQFICMAASQGSWWDCSSLSWIVNRTVCYISACLSTLSFLLLGDVLSWPVIHCRTICLSTGAWWISSDLTTWAQRRSSVTCLSDQSWMASAWIARHLTLNWCAFEPTFYTVCWKALSSGQYSRILE